MSPYKIAALKIINIVSKQYFSKSRTAKEEKFASSLFNKLTTQIKEQEEIKIMFMLLKVMVAEGIMLHGTRRIESNKSDA
jgi:uncharacterized membrane protein